MPANNVLDTFALNNHRICYKEFHIDRTFEAYQQPLPQIQRSEIEKIYNQVERELLPLVTDEKVIRFILSTTEFLKYTYEVLPKGVWHNLIELELIESIKNPAGTGQQNFKWQDRSIWDHLLAARKTKAHDIVAQNTKGQITETSRCNLYIYDLQNDIVFTPTLDSGCINGVLRRHSMYQKVVDLPGYGQKKIFEQDILAAELVFKIDNFKLFAGNSVRGFVPACIITND